MTLYSRIGLVMALSLSASFGCHAASDSKTTPQTAPFYLANRAPLVEKPYLQLPIGAIQPQGWIRQQLEAQATGLTGHLDEVYATVCGPRNCWLGGDGDAWERGPYWIDGLLPLAYILNDKKLIAKTKPWIEWTLASQIEDGQFGPVTDRPYEPGLQRGDALDWWPRMVMLKIMQQYYDATGDKRVVSFLTRYFKYQLEKLPSTPLGKWTFWGQRRGGDNLQVVLWLYNLTGDSFLLELADIIHSQTHDWTRVFTVTDELERQNSLHCVNLGQGFKEPMVYYQRSHAPEHRDAAHRAMQRIRNTIGLPTGLWAGDEYLHFGEPTRGSELCTAVEMMFSLESMLQISGQNEWAEQLERIAYNALPAQTDDAYTARQYYQQNNQVNVSPAWRNFFTPHDDTDILFGVLTGYPCCTCNMHQGWPKLVQNLWYATPDGGAAAMIYAPSTVTLRVGNGEEVRIEESTNYPFDETINFRITPVKKSVKSIAFPLRLRIPSWAKGATVKVNNEEVNVSVDGGTAVTLLQREWKAGDVVTLNMPMQVKCSRWYDGSAVVEHGPLIYALRMNERWEKKELSATRKAQIKGDWYYDVTSDSPWNYGLKNEVVNDPAKHISVTRHAPSDAYPWNTVAAPVEMKVKAVRIKDWPLSRGSVASISYSYQAPYERDYEGEDEITLIPYGCTALRISQFPVRP